MQPLPTISSDGVEGNLAKNSHQPKRKRKETNTEQIEARVGCLNLRSTSTRVGGVNQLGTQGEDVDHDDNINDDNMPTDQSEEPQEENEVMYIIYLPYLFASCNCSLHAIYWLVCHADLSLNDGPQKRRKGRGCTKKHNIWCRGDKPPIQLELNEYGQPVGENGKEFANFIATLVKSKDISLAHTDWRLVQPSQKLKLWNDLKLFYEVDERVKDWVMGTAAKIWRDFKADLKAVHFDETKPDKELLAACDKRVNESDWKWLIKHWRSPLAKTCSEVGKANHAKMSRLHTSGCKSSARVGYEMYKENGVMPRRDELFIKTHTQKNGIRSKAAAPKIQAIEDAMADHPEWTEKTIKDGDLLSCVLGPEKKGYVRSVGKGPTPADLEMPGRKKHTSTKL